MMVLCVGWDSEKGISWYLKDEEQDLIASGGWDPVSHSSTLLDAWNPSIKKACKQAGIDRRKYTSKVTPWGYSEGTGHAPHGVSVTLTPRSANEMKRGV
mgnify:CR=1 FL=1